jgi:hypothetical protein
MALFNTLHDVDDTLRYLIKAHLQDEFPEFKYDNAFTFDSPADIDASTLTTAQVSIFLYQIVENNFLKNNDREFSGDDKMIYPPMFLDLYYLFTPYASERDKEHTILERIMTAFHDHAVLKEPVLQGNLVYGGNTEIRTVSHSFSFDEINKLWERFPNKPFKLSVAYMLTPVKVLSAKEPEPITRVTEKILNVHGK